MTIRASTGLKNAMLGTTGSKAALADGVIRVYSGSNQPADNAVHRYTLLEVTLDGGAFSRLIDQRPELGYPTNGTISKPGGYLEGRRFGQLVSPAGPVTAANPLDDGTSSETLRVDMSVGKGTGDLQLSNVTAVSAPITIDVATLRLP